MHAISTNGATGAPFIVPETLQRRRVLARAGLSPALAGVLAGLAYGEPRRGDVAALAAMTVCRVAGAGVRL